MCPYDYTEAPTMELIPRDTIATLVLHIRSGGVGEDGMLTRTSKGDAEMLVCELTLADGTHKGRKFFENMLLEGTTDGHAEASKISRSRLRAILDSALGLKPNDVSPQARAARTVSLKQFEGMTFTGKIGIEKGGPKKDKAGNLTGGNWPDKKDWKPVEQPPPFNGGGAASSSTPPQSAPPIQRPGWAS